jgi:hypothetical protein
LPLPEFVAGRADVAVAFVVIGEVVARESVVGMLGLPQPVEFDKPIDRPQ